MADINKAIERLLKESTGRALCDSGGAYGRHWERNQARIFTDEQPVTWDEDYMTRNLYHFLVENLDITVESERLQNDYEKFTSGSREYHLADMENWIDKMVEAGELDSDGGYLVPARPQCINTYNGECFLSQTLQYILFFIAGEYYILLQVHQGCDVRGGYTVPRIFAVPDAEQFIMQMTHATVRTKAGNDYWTDDTYHWYSNNNNETKEWADVYAEGIESII